MQKQQMTTKWHIQESKNPIHADKYFSDFFRKKWKALVKIGYLYVLPVYFLFLCKTCFFHPSRLPLPKLVHSSELTKTVSFLLLFYYSWLSERCKGGGSWGKWGQCLNLWFEIDVGKEELLVSGMFILRIRFWKSNPLLFIKWLHDHLKKLYEFLFWF